MAEELRRIREQMAEANRASAGLFFVGIAIALVAVAGTACSAVYLRRHFRLLEADARERLRPALARTACRVVETAGAEGGTRSRHVALEVTNVGAVAAVGVSGYIKCDLKAGDDAVSDPRIIDWPIGALAPNRSSRINISISAENSEAAQGTFWFDVTIEYRAIGGRAFSYRATGRAHGRNVHVSETVP